MARDLVLTPLARSGLVAVIGDRWSLLVIAALTGRTLRFAELRRTVDGVSQKVLTQTLRRLERDGLVRRRVYAEVPPRVGYASPRWGAP